MFYPHFELDNMHTFIIYLVPKASFFIYWHHGFDCATTNIKNVYQVYSEISGLHTVNNKRV